MHYILVAKLSAALHGKDFLAKTNALFASSPSERMSNWNKRDVYSDVKYLPNVEKKVKSVSIHLLTFYSHACIQEIFHVI